MPVGADLSDVSPFGYLMKTPAPPSFIAFVTEPSVYAYVHASSGYLSSQCAIEMLRLIISACVSPGKSWGIFVWIFIPEQLVSSHGSKLCRSGVLSSFADGRGLLQVS